ncbi:uncharacterized protein ALTATR162_LOCUS8634 [Alternaria atra]|uniref:Uncharacterized protein n=1 Tax=Alternaria atra TaxID=119953 RepID=A0A8J2IGH2_9PLEO|nr:uncharacterized protein ALTATR162_LOCUS8634 [Alternaria atra]CAG5178305.1 unnamed protein product [Alternaria atra]
MASQRSADTTHCAILTLPDELLLEFFSHLPHLPRDRRGDLVALTTVDKRIGGIAIEQLHTSVYLNVQNVETLLALYNKRPHLAKLVKSLDLYDQGSAALVGHWWCRSKTIHTCHAYRPQEKSYQTSMIAYLDLATRSGLPESVQKGLRQGLQDLDLDAFLTLLLTAVPNLQHLFLGGLENLEFLKSSIVIDRTRALVLPQMQYASRLARIYERLAVTLKTLELPRYTLHDGRSYGLRSMMSLTRLHLSFDKLHGVMRNVWWELPSGLETLNIWVPEVLQVMEILNSLLAEQQRGGLPLLKDVSIYVDAIDPLLEDGEGFIGYWKCDKKDEFYKSLIDGLSEQEMRVTLRYCDKRAVSAQFHPLMLAANPSMNQHIWFNDLRVLEVRGHFEHLRPQAKKMWMERRKKLIAKKREEQTQYA